MAIGYSLRMCKRHVDSTNPGRCNLVFRSKPIPEAEMWNRLIWYLWCKPFNLIDYSRNSRLCVDAVLHYNDYMITDRPAE